MSCELQVHSIGTDIASGYISPLPIKRPSRQIECSDCTSAGPVLRSARASRKADINCTCANKSQVSEEDSFQTCAILSFMVESLVKTMPYEASEETYGRVMPNRFIFRQVYAGDLSRFLADGEIRAKNHAVPQPCHQTSYQDIVDRRGTAEFAMPDLSPDSRPDFGRIRRLMFGPTRRAFPAPS